MDKLRAVFGSQEKCYEFKQNDISHFEWDSIYLRFSNMDDKIDDDFTYATIQLHDDYKKDEGLKDHKFTFSVSLIVDAEEISCNTFNTIEEAIAEYEKVCETVKQLID